MNLNHKPDLIDNYGRIKFDIHNHIDRDLSINKEEDASMYDPIHPHDLKSLKKDSIMIRSNYLTKNEKKLYLHLVNFNNTINRVKIDDPEDINVRKLIPLLIDLSMSPMFNIHVVSLSILATLTYMFKDIVDELITNKFYESINMNLQEPFFNEQRHVFRWIYNFISTHPEMSQDLLEKVTVEQIYETAIEYIASTSDDYAQNLFYTISTVPNLTYKQAKKCIQFFYYFISIPNKKGKKFALLGIHSIISNQNYPQDKRKQFIEMIGIEHLVAQYIMQDEISRKQGFAIALFGDLIALGYFNHLYLIPKILQLSSDQSLTKWYKEILFCTIKTILFYCDQDTIMDIWRTGYIHHLIKEKETADFSLNIEISFCYTSFINKIVQSELINFINKESFDIINSISYTDNHHLMISLVNAIIRLINFAEENNLTNALYDSILNADCFIAFEDTLSREAVPVELATALQEKLDKLK
ncbi:hypothetical protein TRFO_22586 [Tritrichomonas foetus]|uniref:Uncharacterized protein n=1 Tax=Tritrichomonas foetus TaxID=1144522 RepID=A0A1J4KD10_9EUKA|nr:hypothetical protein TRFO_22586 [Tritrichomonas foetus]|eukprot:OHT08824.1 hypothetical protein TRFO_22586 [Tritrichomonas foetus]